MCSVSGWMWWVLVWLFLECTDVLLVVMWLFVWCDGWLLVVVFMVCVMFFWLV